MRRATHILLGAAAAVPVAVALPPASALGCVWWGMIGGEVPDWLDLRSRAGRLVRLRHRGASHGLPVALLATLLVYLALRELSSLAFPPVAPRRAAEMASAFGAGVLSHLLGDACTLRGIQPWLPFDRRRWWLLPRRLRTRSDGAVDRVGRAGAVVALGLGTALYALRQEVAPGLGW